MYQLPLFPVKHLATFFAASLLLNVATASAQKTFSVGVRGGLNRASTTLADASSFTGINAYNRTADKDAIYAGQVGLVLEAAFGKFAVQPALVFSQKGEKFNTDVYFNGVGGGLSARSTTTNRYNWLELPVNFVYTLHGEHGLQFFAGPYVAMGIGGRQTGTSYFSSPNAFYIPYEFDNQINYHSDTNNRRFDAGMNFGLGYRQGPVQVQAGFGLGFINLHRNIPSIDPGFSPSTLYNFYNDAAYNRVAQLTGTYFFAL
ncbi:MAG: PorT family protein [Hymenobacter sp.]|nr:MAG: PorT family protein [Hymenobacter sp.]